MMNEEQYTELIQKNPEELKWNELIDMLKYRANNDNEEARREMYIVIELLEEDDGNYWKLTDSNAVRLLMYAGYTEEDVLVKLYNKFRSMDRYNEYKERQKSIRKANSPLR